MDARERLAFAAALANMRIDSLRKGQRIDIAEDIEVFLGFGGEPKGQATPIKDLGGIVPIPDKRRPVTEAEADIKFFQSATRKILKGYFESQTGVADFVITGEITILTIKGHSMMQVRAAPHELWKDILVLLLHTSEHAAKLRKCPEDGKYFMKVRRQLYCSRQCVDRVNKRAQRSPRPKGRKK